MQPLNCIGSSIPWILTTDTFRSIAAFHQFIPHQEIWNELQSMGNILFLNNRIQEHLHYGIQYPYTLWPILRLLTSNTSKTPTHATAAWGSLAIEAETTSFAVTISWTTRHIPSLTATYLPLKFTISCFFLNSWSLPSTIGWSYSCRLISEPVDLFCLYSSPDSKRPILYDSMRPGSLSLSFS